MKKWQTLCITVKWYAENNFDALLTLTNFSLQLKYFKSYAQKFDLQKCIHYYCNVQSVQPNVDHAETGKWLCKIKSLKDDKMFEEVFDAVMVCTGHHVKPHIPTFVGQEKFKGLKK